MRNFHHYWLLSITKQTDRKTLLVRFQEKLKQFFHDRFSFKANISHGKEQEDKMYSSESEEDEKIDDLWTFNTNNEDDKTAEELSKEKEKAKKETQKLLQTL